ncbi:MAG: tetratricopeptide repeat protein [Gemmatimonadota bacterium]|nr:tetratricopeptide repeat protein [Gemmatimonadota bacterium]
MAKKKSSKQKAHSRKALKQAGKKTGKEEAGVKKPKEKTTPTLTSFQRLGLVFFGLFLLALLELGLRLLGPAAPGAVGEDPFVGFSGLRPVYYRYHAPDGALRMRTSPGKVQWFNEEDFAAEKEPSVFRIFTLGGSTAYGRPYRSQTSFSAWLAKILNSGGHPPSVRCKVINAGGISYASYRVALVLEEVLRYQPDLIVIYTGHNEFLESRTYRSVLEQPSAVLKAHDYLSRLRLYSLLSRSIGAVRSRLGSSSEKRTAAAGPESVLGPEVETLLDKSAGLELYQRDPVFSAGVFEHFRYNVARMIAMCRDAGVPVVFCRPVDNIKDFSPFKSMASEGLSSRNRTRLTGMVSAGRSMLDEQGDPARAVSILTESVSLDPLYADSYFYLGRAYLAAGDTVSAGRAFLQARELDVCPLRAREPIHKALLEETSKAGVDLINLPAMFRERSAGGLIGNELLADHIHPIPPGHMMIALELAGWIARNGLVKDFRMPDRKTVGGIFSSVMGSLEPGYMSQGVVNLAKVLIWAKKFREVYYLLKGRWEEVSGNGEAQFMMGVVLDRMGNPQDAVGYYREALRLIPGHRMALTLLAMAYEGTGEFEDAEKTYLKALEQFPEDVSLYCNYAIMLARTGKEDKAIEYFQRARRLDPSSPAPGNNIGLIYYNREQYSLAIESFEEVLAAAPYEPQAYHNLGLVYLVLERYDEAEKNFLEALRFNPEYASARTNLGHLYNRTGRQDGAGEQFRLALLMNPHKAEHYINLALLYRDTGQGPLAVQIARAGADLLRGDPRMERLLEAVGGK